MRGGAPRLALAAAGLLFFVSAAAHAASGFPALALARCACDPGTLDALRAEIEAAEDVEAARELAVPPLVLAHEALDRVRSLPGGSELASMELRLREAQLAIDAASTPPAVASAFSAAIGTPSAAGCSYTTLEIVAIVLGFILGIIPGLILLVLLC